jgi:large subunit ribosomal protein L22
MDVKASLRHLRMAPRKVRLVVDAIRNLPVDQAELRLQFIQKDASRPVLKLLQSAIANAEHNFKLDRSKLYVKTITADAGVTLKRFRARAMGRGAPIRKRSTHINIVLSDEPKAPSKRMLKREAAKAKRAPKAVKAKKASTAKSAPKAEAAAPAAN